MSGDTIVAHTADYLGAQGGPTPPPVAPNGAAPAGTSPVDALQTAIAAAGNMGVPGDNANGTKKDAERKASATDAATKFPAGEADAAAQFQGVAGQAAPPAAQSEMSQMMPMVSGVAGAVAGALGGILGPLTQIPQQAAQAAQGAMSPLMSAMQGAGKDSGSADSLDGLSDSDLAGLGEDPSLSDGAGGGGGGGDVGAGGGGGSGDVSGGTVPTSTLGPAPVPASPPTTPAAAAARTTGIAPAASGAPAGAPMGGGMMPMMPGMAGAGSGSGSGSKNAAEEKRIAAPGVAHGAPVRGRMTTPPSVPVTQSVKKDKQAQPPVVTATKKIAVDDKRD